MRGQRGVRRFAIVAVAAAAGAATALVGRAAVGQTITTNFTGSFYGSTGPGFAFTPPDTMGTAGVNHYTELLNGVYAIYSKSGSLISRTSDTQFWIDAFNNSGTPFDPGIDISDPRIMYDPLSRRYFAVEVTTAGPAYQIMAARSNSSDPTAGFKAVRFNAPNTVFPDYPTLGIDANGVYVGANTFPDAGGTSVSLWSLPKADLLLSTPSVANRTAFTQRTIASTGWTPQAVTDFALTKTSTPVLATQSGNPSGATTLRRSTIFNSAGVATMSVSATSITVNSYSVPPNAQQPAGSPSATFDTIDGRFQSAVYQVGNSIWAAHCINIGARAGIRWYQLNATTNTVIQQGNLSEAGYDYHQPSIAANANGDVVIGFTRSGTSTTDGFAGSYALVGSTNSSGTTTFGSLMTLHAGEERYTLNGSGVQRWGDYSATIADPADPQIFWTIQEYARAGNIWGTNISEITIPLAGEFRWKDPVDGEFSTAAAWLSGSVPSTGNHAIFSRPTDGAGSYTVTIGSPQTSDRMSVRQGHVNLVLNNATYTVTNSSLTTPSIVVGEFGGSPLLDLRGSGTLSSVNASLAPNVNSDATVTLIQTPTWNNSGDLYLGGTNAAAGGIATLTLSSGAGSSPTLAIGGRLKVWNAGAVNYNAGSLSAATLDLASGGRILLSSGGGKTLRSGAVSIAGTGKIDLADNRMIVDYSGASPAVSIRAMLIAGYNAGAWTGNGITSSSAAAAAASAHQTALGYAEATDIFTTLPNTYRGQPVDATTLIIQYTASCDANLDGTVDTLDFNSLAANFGGTNRIWSQADFNYDGVVDTLDFNALAANFGFTVPADQGGALVPEPDCIAVLALALSGFATGRRRGSAAH
jgi:hypothetical protein